MNIFKTAMVIPRFHLFFLSAVWCVLGEGWFGVQPALAQFGTLKAESQERVRRFGAEADAITARVEQQLLEAGKKLLPILEQQLKVLARERRLTEAAALKELNERLSRCTSGRKFEEMLLQSKLPPAAGVHLAISHFFESTRSLLADACNELIPLRDQFILDVDRFPDADNPGLQQLREQLMLLTNADADWGPIELPADPEDAKLAQYRCRQEAAERYEKRWKIALFPLCGKLQGLLEQATEQERFDEANTIQELFKQLESQPDPDRVAGFLNSQRTRLPAAAVDVLQQFVQWNENEKIARRDFLKELERLGLPLAGEELGQRLRVESEPGWSLESALKQYYSAQGEVPKWLTKWNEGVPEPSGEPGKILKDFDRQLQQQLRALDADDLKRRETLIQFLKDAQKNLASPTAAEAIENTLQLLQADYATGFRGALLLEDHPDLDEASREQVEGYRQAAKAARDGFRQDHDKNLAAVREKLQPAREHSIQKGEYSDAYFIIAALARRKNPYSGIWVLYVSDPVMGPMLTLPDWRQLVDVGEQGYYLRMAGPDDSRSGWVARENVLLSLTEIRSPDELFRDFSPNFGFSKGAALKPIGDHVRLKIGRKVQGLRQGAWTDFAIEDLSPFGIVRFINGPEHAPVVYPRSAISLSR